MQFGAALEGRSHRGRSDTDIPIQPGTPHLGLRNRYSVGCDLERAESGIHRSRIDDNSRLDLGCHPVMESCEIGSFRSIQQGALVSNGNVFFSVPNHVLFSAHCRKRPACSLWALDYCWLKGDAGVVHIERALKTDRKRRTWKGSSNCTMLSITW